jgi:valyl-tRNA synthetase
VLLALIKLFAPILPHVTEQIYQGVFAGSQGQGTSIHRSSWPVVDEGYLDEEAEDFGEVLLEIATTVRRYKSERNLSLGTELSRLQLATGDAILAQNLENAIPDLLSITRARLIEISINDTQDFSIQVEV